VIVFLDKLEYIINKLVGIVLTSCFSLFAGVCFVQVISRYILKVSLPWSEELSRYLFIYATYLGSVIAVTSGSHVSISIVDSLLEQVEPGRREFLNGIIDIFTSLMSAVVLGWITYLAAPYLVNVYRFGQRSPAMRISMCIPMSSVLVGMGLMFFLYVKKILKGILCLYQGKGRSCP